MNEFVWLVYCHSCGDEYTSTTEVVAWTPACGADEMRGRCLRCTSRLYAPDSTITKITLSPPPPPPAVKVRRAPLPGVKVTHMVCGGCGELFQPKEPKQVVCDAACRSVQEQEQKKARDHAYRVRAGVLE